MATTKPPLPPPLPTTGRPNAGSNVEGGGHYRTEEYYKGDGGLCYVYLPDADEDGTPEGRPGGDRHPPARR